jgi:invasion protein IalB
MVRLLPLAILLCTLVGTETFAQAPKRATKLPEVTYSAWSKWCLKDEQGRICFTGRDARNACGSIAAVLFIERDGDPTTRLQVRLPANADRSVGARIVVADDKAVMQPFKECLANGCMAEHQEHANRLVPKLRWGWSLGVHGIGPSKEFLRADFPLAGFADAYDGPGSVLRAFEEQQRDLQTELKRRQNASDKTRKLEGC